LGITQNKLEKVFYSDYKIGTSLHSPNIYLQRKKHQISLIDYQKNIKTNFGWPIKSELLIAINS